MAALTVLDIVLFAGIALFMLVAKVLKDIDIYNYLRERERQKTIRKLADVQKEREALGVAENRELFEKEQFNIEDALSEYDESDSKEGEIAKNLKGRN